MLLGAQAPADDALGGSAQIPGGCGAEIYELSEK